jgi:hypothetical protein
MKRRSGLLDSMVNHEARHRSPGFPASDLARGSSFCKYFVKTAQFFQI